MYINWNQTRLIISLIILFISTSVIVVYSQNDTTSTVLPKDESLHQMRVALDSASHDTTHLLIYENIGDYYLFDHILLDSALYYYHKAEKIALQYPSYLASIYNRLGRNYTDLWETRGAINNYLQLSYFYYDKSIYYATRYKEDDIYLKSSWNKLNQHISSGSIYTFFEEGFYFLDYIQKKPELGYLDSVCISLVLKNICIQSEYDMESDFFSKYLGLAKKYAVRQTDKEKLVLIEFEQLTRTAKAEQEEYVKGQYNLLKKSIKEMSNLHELDIYYADYFFNIKKHADSINLCLKSLSILFDKLENEKAIPSLPYEIGLNQLIIGKNYFSLQEYNLAADYLNQANDNLKIYPTEFYELYLSNFYLSKTYYKLGNYRQAYLHRLKADSLHEKLSGIKIQRVVAEKDGELMVAEKDRKLKELRLQNSINEIATKNYKREKLLFAVLFGLALLALIVGFFSYRKQQGLHQIISQQNKSLEKSNQIKDKMFAMLSHDLRSPISQLSNRLELLKVENPVINPIYYQLQQTQFLLDNVLQWASRQIKSFAPSKIEELPIASLIASTVTQCETKATQKGITLVKNVENQQVRANANELLLVLRNVLSNAIKFSVPNSYVLIKTTLLESENWLVVTIKDTGKGMSSAQLENVFNYPTPEKGTQGEAGTGLGLSLSKDLVERWGGKLELQSEIGKGTSVKLFLRGVGVFESKSPKPVCEQ